MNYLEKTLDISIFDLIIVASVGGVIVYIISKIIDFSLVRLFKKYRKPIMKISRTIKQVRNAKENKKNLPEEYSAQKYNQIRIASSIRYLFLFERRYLNKYKVIHDDNQSKLTNFVKENIKVNPTPWK